MSNSDAELPWKLVIPITLNDLVEKLRNGEHFSFARYGDGEWQAILGPYEGANADGCRFTVELSKSLKRIFINQYPYYHALLRIARRKRGQEISRFLKTYHITMPLFGGDVLLDKNLTGNLFPLIEQIRGKRVLYVGPNHLRGLKDNFFQYEAFINAPPNNAILHRKRIIRSVLRAVANRDIEVIGWSSGLAAKVFIDDVYGECGDTVTQIDFGSLFDGYFGVPSRTYIRRIKWEGLFEINAGKRKRRKKEAFRK